MARINVRKISKTTLLVIGEGAHDTAFLNHLKSLYDARESGQKVKIESGDGGSPHDLIKNTSVHDKFHIALVLSGFFFLKIARIFLNSSFFPKPIKRRIAI